MNIPFNFIRTKKAVAILILTFLITSSTVSTISADEEKIDFKETIFNLKNLMSKLKEILNTLFDDLFETFNPPPETGTEPPEAEIPEEPEDISEIPAEPQDVPEAPTSEQPPENEGHTTFNSPPNKPEIPYNSDEFYIALTGVASLDFLTSAIDPDGDKIKYAWDWNGDGHVDDFQDNNGDLYESGETVNNSYSWISAGTYEIKVRAIDEHGAKSKWSDSRSVQVKDLINRRPSSPQYCSPPTTPVGPTIVHICTIDAPVYWLDVPACWKTYGEPGHKIQFDWGDGHKSPWYDTDPLDGAVYASRGWSEVGNYYIRARQKTPDGSFISGWSGSITITVVDWSNMNTSSEERVS
jgi:hypothetical protein